MYGGEHTAQVHGHPMRKGLVAQGEWPAVRESGLPSALVGVYCSPMKPANAALTMGCGGDKLPGPWGGARICNRGVVSQSNTWD